MNLTYSTSHLHTNKFTNTHQTYTLHTQAHVHTTCINLQKLTRARTYLPKLTGPATQTDNDVDTLYIRPALIETTPLSLDLAPTQDAPCLLHSSLRCDYKPQSVIQSLTNLTPYLFFILSQETSPIHTSSHLTWNKTKQNKQQPNEEF